MLNGDFKKKLKKLQKPLILLIVVIIMTILQPRAFLTWNNFQSILYAISIYGIMVCGSIFPILLGGIDLSVGSVAALSGAASVMTILHFGQTDTGVILGVLCGLIVGVLVGSLQGIIVSNFKVPPFLITLASLNIVSGIAQLITGNQTISCMEPRAFTFIGGGRLLGVPVPIYLLAIMGIISYIILNKMVFGRQIYAVGGNPQASNLSGIASKKITVLAYLISGFTAAMAGIVLASMNQQAIAKAATGYENDVLTAIVVGGTSLMGGEGSIQGALFGALLVGLLNNGLRLMGVPATYHTVIKGIVIVAAVAFDIYSKNKGSGLQRSLFRRKKKAMIEGSALK
jgi:ribose transport system permease protein